MTSQIDTIRTAGQLLYGESWQAPLSRDTSTSERSMRRWAAGKDPIPDGVFRDISLLLETRAIDLDECRRQIAALIQRHTARPKKTAKELEVMILEAVVGCAVCPPSMTITVWPKGDSWEALPNSNQVIAYADCVREIHKTASKLRLQFDLAANATSEVMPDALQRIVSASQRPESELAKRLARQHIASRSPHLFNAENGAQFEATIKETGSGFQANYVVTVDFEGSTMTQPDVRVFEKREEALAWIDQAAGSRGFAKYPLVERKIE